MNKFTFLIFTLCAFAWSSIIDLDAQRKVLDARQTIETQMSSMHTLPSELTKELRKLRSESIELSEIIYSRKCNSVSIHTIPDKTCDNFYKKSQKFINSYAKWTNSFFASRVKLMKQEKSFRKKLNTCVEMMSAFLNPNMTPEALFPHKLNVDITRRTQTLVKISLKPTDPYNTKKWKFHGNTSGYNRNGEVKYLKKYFMPWTKMCRDIAVYPESVEGTDMWAGHFDKEFIKQVKEYWKDSPYTFEHTKLGMATGINIGFKKRRSYILEILVNGQVYKEVTVEYALEANEPMSEQPFMYLDNLPVNEIRFQLGSPARHAIAKWDVFIDGDTEYSMRNQLAPTVSKTFVVPEGNVEVRVKN